VGRQTTQVTAAVEEGDQDVILIARSPRLKLYVKPPVEKEIVVGGRATRRVTEPGIAIQFKRLFAKVPRAVADKIVPKGAPKTWVQRQYGVLFWVFEDFKRRVKADTAEKKERKTLNRMVEKHDWSEDRPTKTSPMAILETRPEAVRGGVETIGSGQHLAEDENLQVSFEDLK
jgi:hypothetical protein